jgi:hypothetical protein
MSAIHTIPLHQTIELLDLGNLVRRVDDAIYLLDTKQELLADILVEEVEWL